MMERTARLCAVSVRCVAMLADAHRDAMLTMLRDWRRVATSGGGWYPAAAHPPLAPLWDGIFSLGTVPRTPDAHLANVVFDGAHPAFAGRTVVAAISTTGAGAPDYASRRFSGLGLADLPSTMLSALPGRPMTDIVDHPLFEGLALEEGGLAVPFGPDATIPVDERLPDRVETERRRLLEALERRNHLTIQRTRP